MIDKHAVRTLDMRSRIMSVLRFAPLNFIALSGWATPPLDHGLPGTAAQL